jgi:NTE family protein
MSPMSRAEALAERPFTLGMSAGFFGFYAHAGVLCALQEADVAPIAVAGASAGALIGGLWASGLDATAVREAVFSVDRAAFWDPGLGWGVLRGERLDRLLESWMPTRSFTEARVPASFSAYDVVAQRTTTLAGGDLILAMRASASFPGMFHPVRIDGRWLSDGGIADRSGLSGVPGDAFVVQHHLGSRSPWRRRNSEALLAPSRPNTWTLVVSGLPRVSPFRLEAGAEAFSRAYDAACAWLREPVAEPVR